jgi:hypothetical protein
MKLFENGKPNWNLRKPFQVQGFLGSACHKFRAISTERSAVETEWVGAVQNMCSGDYLTEISRSRFKICIPYTQDTSIGDSYYM